MQPYAPLVNQQEIADAWATFCERMRRGSEAFERRNGWPGGGGTYTVFWHPTYGIWATLGTDWEHGRHWCGLGTDYPVTARNLGQVCQINPPTDGVNRQCAGLFVRDGAGAVYVTHSGKVGGGRPGISKSGFVSFFKEGRSVPVSWPDGKTTNVFMIGRIDADDLVAQVATFVDAVERYKQDVVRGGNR